MQIEQVDLLNAEALQAGIDVDAIDLQDVSDEDWASIMFDVEHAYMAHLAHQQEAERVRVEELEALNFQKLEQAEREQQLAQREKDLKDQVLALRIKTLEQLGWESNDSRIWYIGYSSREFAYFDNMDSATFADWVKGFGEWKADQAKLVIRQEAFVGLGWQSDGGSGHDSFAAAETSM